MQVLSGITNKDRYRAVSELVREGRESANYYSLLVLSAVIIAAGLLLANSAILIGGMLVTPVLTPILLLTLGIVTSRPRVIKNTAKLIAKSVGLIFVVAFLASLLFGVPEDQEFFSAALFNDSIKAAFLYFLVALASGVAATFAWISSSMVVFSLLNFYRTADEVSHNHIGAEKIENWDEENKKIEKK
jgi:uncharacterized membrane protein